MRRVNRNALRKLRDNLWLAQRAFDYSALRAYVPDADMSSVDHALLANALFNTRAELSTHLTLAAGPAQVFPVSNAQRFIIRVPLAGDLLRQLQENGTIFVSLRPLLDHPKGYERAAEVYANTIRVRIGGLRSFDGYLTHLRASRFRRQSGDLIQYHLTPSVWKIGADVPIMVGTDDVAPNGQRYLGLSPFSDWMLSVSNSENISRRAAVIEFEFTGTMRTIDNGERA